jgi:hypothetical protein
LILLLFVLFRHLSPLLTNPYLCFAALTWPEPLGTITIVTKLLPRVFPYPLGVYRL